MKELLQEELAAGVPISIADKKYRLAFPIGAVILYKKHIGDSLFKFSSWIKPGPDNTLKESVFLIGPEEGPEKFVFALYAGIYGGQLLAGHRGDPDPAILDELEARVFSGNSAELERALVRALLAFMVPERSSEETDQVPTTAAIAS